MFDRLVDAYHDGAPSLGVYEPVNGAHPLMEGWQFLPPRVLEEKAFLIETEIKRMQHPLERGTARVALTWQLTLKTADGRLKAEKFHALMGDIENSMPPLEDPHDWEGWEVKFATDTIRRLNQIVSVMVGEADRSAAQSRVDQLKLRLGVLE